MTMSMVLVKKDGEIKQPYHTDETEPMEALAEFMDVQMCTSFDSDAEYAICAVNRYDWCRVYEIGDMGGSNPGYMVPQDYL